MEGINHSCELAIKRLLISWQMFTLLSICRSWSLVVPDKIRRLTHKGLALCRRASDKFLFCATKALQQRKVITLRNEPLNPCVV